MPEAAAVRRRLPVGAEIVTGVGTHFRVWAPRHRGVTLVLEPSAESRAREVALAPEGGGYFSVLAVGVGAGSKYRFRLGDAPDLFPDLASRFQPEGPLGPSEVVDPAVFRWTDEEWPGVSLAGQVLYEMHVGTFTREGTWAAAQRQLPELRSAGMTVLEVMPVADFPGRFGWGYDGVDLFAPTRLYGAPDDFRAFVNAAHEHGLGVILDVVYNHVGPEGAFFNAYAEAFFSKRYKGEWGDPINFDGQDSGPVREFFRSNAGYWIREFHLDGLRLDATQTIYDSSPEHIVAVIAGEARAAAGERSIILVGENESQQAHLACPPEQGGYGLDALWNDDYHHSALVALTGRNEAYYTDYLGLAQEFVSVAKRGFLYQGQHYAWQGKGRGAPTWALPPSAFVNYLENHDQLANSTQGRRVHQLSSPGRYRAMLALTLLGPGTPLFFQGQEFAASAPFVYFADHEPNLAMAVRKGRFEFLTQFPSLGGAVVQAMLPDPSSPDTFARCRLDFSERDTHREAYDLTRDLLRLRREDPVVREQRQGGLDGAVLAPHAFVLRLFAGSGHHDDRVLLVNFGRDLPLHVAPEPLLAPPLGRTWTIAWSSDDPKYGGHGIAPLITKEGMRVPGEALLLLVRSEARPEDERRVIELQV